MNQNEQFRLMGDTDSDSDDLIIGLENQSLRLYEDGGINTRITVHKIRWENFHWTGRVYCEMEHDTNTEEIPVEFHNGTWRPTKQYFDRFKAN